MKNVSWKKIALWSAAGAAVVALIVVSLVMNQSARTGAAPHSTEAGGILVDADGAVAGPIDEIDLSEIPEGTTPAASEDGPPSLVVYVDPACPHCKNFEDSYGGYLNALASEGLIQLEYRVVSIMGSYSENAAEALACVAEQAPENYTGFLQHTLDEAENDLDRAGVVALAGEYDVDISDCMDSQKYKGFVNYTTSQARGVIDATPSVWLDGEQWDTGSQPLDQWVEGVIW